MRKLEVGHEYRNDDLGYSVDGAIFVEVDSPTQVHIEYVDGVMDNPECPVPAALGSSDPLDHARFISAVRSLIQQQWGEAYVDWANGHDPEDGICYALEGDPRDHPRIKAFLDYITHMTDRANYGPDSIYGKALSELGA